jgi:hypothetical protein
VSVLDLLSHGFLTTLLVADLLILLSLFAAASLRYRKISSAARRLVELIDEAKLDEAKAAARANGAEFAPFVEAIGVGVHPAPPKANRERLLIGLVLMPALSGPLYALLALGQPPTTTTVELIAGIMVFTAVTVSAAAFFGLVTLSLAQRTRHTLRVLVDVAACARLAAKLPPRESGNATGPSQEATNG